MTHRTVALAAAVFTGVLLLSACGSGGSGEADKSPDQIIKDMAAAIKSVHSFHLKGSVTSSGTPTAIDLTVAGPQSLTGSVTEKAATAHLVLANGSFYIQGKQFFTVFANPQAAAVVGDNWVKLPTSIASSVQSSFAAFTNTSTFSSCFSGLKNPSSLSKSATTVNGVSVVELTGGGSTIDVQASGPAYPVRFSSTGSASPFIQSSNSACSTVNSSSSGAGAINFDSWGTTPTVTAPPSALDFSSLGG